MRRSLLLGCSLLFLLSASPSWAEGQDGSGLGDSKAPSAIPDDQTDSKGEFPTCAKTTIGLVIGDSSLLVGGSLLHEYQLRKITFGYLDTLGESDIAKLDDLGEMKGQLVSKQAEWVEARQIADAAREKSSKFQSSGELFLPKDPSAPSTQVPDRIPEYATYMNLESDVRAAKQTLEGVTSTFDQIHGGEGFVTRHIQAQRELLEILKKPETADGWSDYGVDPASVERDIQADEETLARYLAQKTKAEEELTWAERAMTRFKTKNQQITQRILAFENESERLRIESANLGGIASRKVAELHSLLDDAKNKAYKKTETALLNAKGKEALGVADDEMRLPTAFDSASDDLMELRGILGRSLKCVAAVNVLAISTAGATDIYRIAKNQSKITSQNQSAATLDDVDSVFNQDSAKKKGAANAGTQP